MGDYFRGMRLPRPASPGLLVACAVGRLFVPMSAEYSRAHPSNEGSQLVGN
jgi:hypothetical protein